MRHLKTTTFAALFIALLAPSLALAAPPAILPVQGYITDSLDIPINGTRNVKFELFTASTGGTSLYASTITGLNISEGYFTAYLGDSPQPALTLSNFRDQDIVWLEISVGAETMAPRLQVGSVGFAAAARYCGDSATLGGAALSSLQNRVTGTCNANQKMIGINADGTVMCSADIDTDTTYTASATGGLALAGTVFSLDATGCVGNEVLKRNAGNTDWDCVPDVDTDTDTNAGTLCANGQYLDGDGTCKAVLDTTGELTPLLDASYVNVNEADSVNANMIATDAVGAAEIAVDAVGAAEIAAGAVGTSEIGVNSVGTAEIIATEVQNRVSGTCLAGQYITAVNQAGTVACADDAARPGTVFTVYGGSSWGATVTGGLAAYQFGMSPRLVNAAVGTVWWIHELPMPDMVGGLNVLFDSITVEHSCSNAQIDSVQIGTMTGPGGYSPLPGTSSAVVRTGSGTFTIVPTTPTAVGDAGHLQLNVNQTAAGGGCYILFYGTYHY